MAARDEISLSIADVLRLPGLRPAQLLAGSDGDDRVIVRMNMMEVPDILPWVRPRELLVTSGYPLRGYDTRQLAELVRGLHAKGIGGLALKVGGRYLPHLPGEIISLANELQLPIIRMPLDLAFTDLQEQFYRQVLALHEAHVVSAAEQRQRGDRIRRLLESRTVDSALIQEWATEAQVPHTPQLVVVIRGRAELGIENYQRLAGRAAQEKWAAGWLLQAFGDCLIGLAPVVGDADELVSYVETFVATLPHVQAGLGGLAPAAADLPRSYRQALRAIEVAERFPTVDGTVAWWRLGLQRVVDSIMTAGVGEELVEAALGPVAKEPELRATLERFLRLNCSLAETARETHFHYNTIRQRVRRIEAALGPFVDNAQRRAELLIACEVDRHLRS